MLRFLNKSCSSDEYDDHILQDFITVARQVSAPALFIHMQYIHPSLVSFTGVVNRAYRMVELLCIDLSGVYKKLSPCRRPLF